MGWLISLGLCLAGLAAIIVELFVPAAGVIGILGLGSIIGGIVLAYVGYGTAVGAAYLVGTILAVPVLLALYFRVFPRSIIGRWLILSSQQRSDEGFAAFPREHDPGLAGRTGAAATPLRPAGIAVIDGRKYSVVTVGDFVEKGDIIQVVRVEGSRVVVRKETP